MSLLYVSVQRHLLVSNNCQFDLFVQSNWSIFYLLQTRMALYKVFKNDPKTRTDTPVNETF